MIIAFVYFLICAGLAIAVPVIAIVRHRRVIFSFFWNINAEGAAAITFFVIFIGGIVIAVCIGKEGAVLGDLLGFGTWAAGVPAAVGAHALIKRLRTPRRERPRTKIPQARTVNR